MRVIPISEKFEQYGQTVLDSLLSSGIRASIDNASDSLGKRIHNADKLKLPYVLIVGQSEQESNQVAVRKYALGDQGSSSLEELTSMLLGSISNRTNG